MATAMTKKTATAVPKTQTKKQFSEHDGITCVSCTAGELLVEGPKTKTLYDWHGIGDSYELEYGDLISLVRSKSKYVFKPRFIIQNQDFINQNKEVKEFYENMYSLEDLRGILSMSDDEIREILPKLPVGAQETVKSLASGAVEDGTLDSVKAIKAFDEFFGTKLMFYITGKS